ncbi:conditioned medium factor receptor 1-like [Haliotis rufescens]|uniref:conditioned medium factor receptor 1-like n=1 Tax=Haliotis rufescens TaxID=6454 RepID=UPI00201F9DC3|nr:conditioned medium factor receptor 1-like [Haliotis rufescens]
MDLFLIGIVFIVVVLLLIIVLGLTSSEKEGNIKDFPSKYPEQKTAEKEHYDVAIVGAGPSGSVCGYYLGKAGWKCLLLEKKKFPRDKYCGDAVCKTGIEILMDMGIYDQLIKQNKAHVSDNGGMCSPGGLSFIGRSQEGFGPVPAALACKRIHLDEAIAMAAKRAGADLREECSVDEAIFDKNKGLWTVTLDNSDTRFTARVLVCADGAQSRLATKLGLVTRPPDSTCSRSYVEGGTHKFKADGVIFYNKTLLPGYSALFRHPNDVLNYCCYIIPGNPEVKGEDLAHWHEWLKTNDPNIKRALGPDHKIERMKAASLRIGGEKVSYGDHVIVIGDAAGMIDPMTGEGIHHAMEAGQIAAQFLQEVLLHGNYDSDVMKIFHQRWMSKFGYDFWWSMIFAQLVFRFPILIDAATAAVKRKGDKFLLKWADIMTGRVPKLHMLKPEFTIVITYELVRLIIGKLFRFGGKDKKEE